MVIQGNMGLRRGNSQKTSSDLRSISRERCTTDYILDLSMTVLSLTAKIYCKNAFCETNFSIFHVFTMFSGLLLAVNLHTRCSFSSEFKYIACFYPYNKEANQSRTA